MKYFEPYYIYVVNACTRVGERMSVLQKSRKNVSNELFGVRRPIKRIVLRVDCVTHVLAILH